MDVEESVPRDLQDVCWHNLAVVRQNSEVRSQFADRGHAFGGADSVRLEQRQGE
jgi:hypothetical protein